MSADRELIAYVISVGGAGAKVLDAIVHCSALGIIDRNPNPTQSQSTRLFEIQVLIVDPDTSNGNIESATKSIELYQACRPLIRRYPDDHHTHSINLLGILSPFGESIPSSFQDIFSYFSYRDDSRVKYLFDMLYTSEERAMTLRQGFRGRPSIGSAAMSVLNPNSEKVVNEIVSKMRAEVGQGKEVKVFICGSIFGGTGASGLPSISRILSGKMKEAGIRDEVSIGGGMLLPYFSFPVPENTEGIHTRPGEFSVRTKSSLYYYGTYRQDMDIFYLLGLPSLDVVGDFSLGGQSQKNKAQIIEMYAALAFRDFIFRPGNQDNNRTPGEAAIISRANSSEISWKDMPQGDYLKRKFVGMSRFAYAWLCAVIGDLNYSKRMGQYTVPWSLKFFKDLRDIRRDQPDIDSIRDMSVNFLDWALELHDTSSDRISLLPNITACYRKNGQVRREDFVGLADDRNSDVGVIFREMLSFHDARSQSGVKGLVSQLLYLCER